VEQVEGSNDPGADQDGNDKSEDGSCSTRNENVGLWLPKDSYRSTLTEKTSASASESTSPRVALSDDRKAHLLAKLRELDIQEGVQVRLLPISVQSYSMTRLKTRMARYIQRQDTHGIGLKSELDLKVLSCREKFVLKSLTQISLYYNSCVVY
jgi:hypothetical protein